MWETAEQVQYPYLTVCHPRFFNKTKLEEYNVDDRLANYMIMALDPSMEILKIVLGAEIVGAEIGGSHTDAFPTLSDIQGLEDDLQAVLSRENATIGQLFKKVAIR